MAEKKSHRADVNLKKILLSIPFIIVILSVSSVSILLPTKIESYQVEVPYIDKETYSVNVPYEDIKEKIVSVPYETTEQYVESVPVNQETQVQYTIESVKCTASGLFSTGESTWKVTNLDSGNGGTFTIRVGYIDNSGQFVGSTQSKNIQPSSSTTFTYSPTPSSFQGCSRQVIDIPTKTTTEYKDVIKTKTVTKYRDETQYEKVTKIRTEMREREVQKTRVEERHKEVNWLFGFDSPIKFRELPKTVVLKEG